MPNAAMAAVAVAARNSVFHGIPPCCAGSAIRTSPSARRSLENRHYLTASCQLRGVESLNTSGRHTGAWPATSADTDCPDGGGAGTWRVD